MRRTTAVALRALAVLPMLAAAGAWGEVTLETTVSKVATTLDDAGTANRELVPADQVVPGEELRYTITFENDSDMVVDAGRIIVTTPIPDGTVYVDGSAGGDATLVEYSTDGQTFSAGEPEAGAGSGPGAGTADDGPPPVTSLRWTYQQDVAPGQSGQVYFHVRMQ